MLITDDKTLNYYCKKAFNKGVIAFDTEFMRDKTYYPKLSLVQIATKEDVFAVDMTLGLDYSPLAELLANDRLLKVIHSARQDIELLYYFFGFIPKNLFDTQIAALFLGYKDSPSFESMVGEFLNKKISKELQFSDWLIRPLSENQLKYALEDANLLYDLFFKMREKLHSLQRFEWALEESNLIACGSKFAVSIDNMLMKFTNHLSKEVDLSICYRLLMWREAKAKTLNVPRSHIIKDEVVAQLCNRKPDTIEKLSKFKFRPHFTEEDRKEILQILTIEAISEDHHNIVKGILAGRKSNILQKNNLFSMLKILTEVRAKSLGLQESLLATTSDILLITHNKTSKLETGWRKKAIGEIIHAFKNGQIHLGYKDGEFFIA